MMTDLSAAWVSTRAAADIFKAAGLPVAHRTIQHWCYHVPGLARRFGGRWRVRRDTVERIAAGVPLVEAGRHG